MNTASAGKCGLVGHALWVVLGDGSIPELASCSWDWESIVRGRTFDGSRPWNLGIDESEAGEGSESNGGVHYGLPCDELEVLIC